MHIGYWLSFRFDYEFANIPTIYPYLEGRSYLNMRQIPENLEEFFYWVKERTESKWSSVSGNSKDDPKAGNWINGARWIPLESDEIDKIEEKYGVRFMPEHRLFLKILHAIDRKEVIEVYSSSENEGPKTVMCPFFYNWLEDEAEIRSKLDWPYRTILEDVLGPNQVWLKSWGQRPSSDEDKRRIFSEWYGSAPILLPLKSHRFLMSRPDLTDRPVLSVYGSDIIVYGWDLRTYLLNELHRELDFLDSDSDEKDQCNYSHFSKETDAILSNSFAVAPIKDIPYWKEMILFWTSGWSSFGMKSPRDNGEPVQPIMKTYIAGEGDDVQKQFIG